MLYAVQLFVESMHGGTIGGHLLLQVLASTAGAVKEGCTSARAFREASPPDGHTVGPKLLLCVAGEHDGWLG